MLWITVTNLNWTDEDSKFSRNAREAADPGLAPVPDHALDHAPGAVPGPVLVLGAALAPGPGTPAPGADPSLVLNLAPSPGAVPDPEIVMETLQNPMETKRDPSPAADLGPVPNRGLSRDPGPAPNPGTIEHEKRHRREIQIPELTKIIKSKTKMTTCKIIAFPPSKSNPYFKPCLV